MKPALPDNGPWIDEANALEVHSMRLLKRIAKLATVRFDVPVKFNLNAHTAEIAYRWALMPKPPK